MRVGGHFSLFTSYEDHTVKPHAHLIATSAMRPPSYRNHAGPASPEIP